MKIQGLRLRGLGKQLYYLSASRPFKLEKPIVLQFPVIDICNSQCQMCRIWENKKSDDLSPEQLRMGLRNPLFSEVSGIGLNGGEPTLRKDLGGLTAVLFDELPKLQSIALITNAYKYDEVIARIADVGNVVKQHDGMLDVMISLDGFGEVHDRVRGKSGNFERAQHVIEFAQASPLVSNVRIGCTIIKENVYGLSDLFEFCQSKGLYIKYRLGIPHQRLYTQNLLDPYALDAAEKYHIAEFLEGLIIHYETSEHQKFFYRSLIDQIILHAPRKAGCDWKHRGATITSKGTLYCAVQSKVLGNVLEQDSEHQFFANEGHLKEIIQNHCDSCNHDYVGIPPRAQLAKQFVMQVAKKIHAEPLVKGFYHKLLRSNWRRKQQFSSRLDRLRKLGQLAQSWPVGGAGMRVLVCGWYGTETLGDKAILGGILQALRKQLGEIDIVLVSLFPYVSEMTRRQMDELKGIPIVNTERGIQLAASADLVVFGGGPLMAIDEIADMLAIFEAAKRVECRILVAGCGVGPLGAPWHNDAIIKLLKLADVRIYRDVQSRDTSAKLGVSANSDLVAEDPAFTWLVTQRELSDQMKFSGARKVLLLGLRDFPYITYAHHLSKVDCLAIKQHYEAAVLEAMTRLVTQYPDLIIRPLPMCTNHFGDDDRWFYRRLFRGNTILAAHLDLSLLGQELPPLAYCEAFTQATVALTMRFHATVFALGLEVPTVAIDYTLGQGKVHSLAERFGVPHCSLAELEANFIVQEVSRLLESPRPQAPGFIPTFPEATKKAILALGIAPVSYNANL